MLRNNKEDMVKVGGEGVVVGVCVFDYTGMRLPLTSIRLLINLIMKRQLNPR